MVSGGNATTLKNMDAGGADSSMPSLSAPSVVSYIPPVASSDQGATDTQTRRGGCAALLGAVAPPSAAPYGVAEPFARGARWLSHLESNQNSRYQKPVCSRYTMGQSACLGYYTIISTTAVRAGR